VGNSGLTQIALQLDRVYNSPCFRALEFPLRILSLRSRSEVELHTELQLSCIADGTEYRIKGGVLNIPVWNA
jgi:hypothetical protein